MVVGVEFEGCLVILDNIPVKFSIPDKQDPN